MNGSGEALNNRKCHNLDGGDLERLILAHSPRFQALLDRSRQSIKAGKGLSRDELWMVVQGCNQEPVFTAADE